jgi:integrase/recombinase XerD
MLKDPPHEEFSLYLKHHCGLCANTVKSYTSDIAPWISKAGSLSSATRESITLWLDSLTLTARSRARKISALRLFFKFATAKGWCNADPTSEMETPRIGRSLPKTLSLNEVEKLLEAPPAGSGDSIMLRVLYASGLRVSELVTLPAEAIDTQSGILRVQGKGDKVRIVPIDAGTAAEVTRYLREIRPGLREKHRGKAEREALFLSRHGRPFTRQGFWKLVKKYAFKAGIPSDVSPHILRHAFATHLMEHGMNLRSLQMLLGHSDISTTEIYSHVSTSHLHDTVNRFHPRRK